MARQREFVTNVAQRPRFMLGRAHYARRVPGAFIKGAAEDKGSLKKWVDIYVPEIALLVEAQNVHFFRCAA